MPKPAVIRQSPTRRGFLRGAGGTICAAISGAGVAGLAGCNTPLAGNLIRFWNGFTGPDGRTMLRLVDRFNQTTEGGAVVMQRTDWATYYSKLFVAGLGKRAPEIFVLQAEQIARFVRAGLVRHVDDVLAPGLLPPEDFDPNVLEIVTFGGSRFGVPLDVHPLGTFYNERLLERAGVKQPPVTGEEFRDCMERLASLRGQEGLNLHPFVHGWLRLNAFTAMWQWGGEVFTDDGGMCILTSPEAVAGFEWCADLVRQGWAPSPENFDAWVGFRQGRVGVAWHGLFMLADLQKTTNLPWAAAPVSQVGPMAATWGGSHVLCLRADLEGDQLEAAVAFIKFLSDQSVAWAEGGQVPARRSLRETSGFQQMTAQAVFAQQLPYVKFMPQVPFVQEYLTAFDFAIERALRGSVSALAALEEAEQAINQAIARYRSAGWDPETVGPADDGGVV